METTVDLTEVWTLALDSLTEGSLTPQQRAFVSLTRPLGLVEDTALIAAPNDFTKDVLETRLRPVVTAALSAQLGRDVRLAVTVDPGIAATSDEDEVDALADATYQEELPDLEPEPQSTGPAAARRAHARRTVASTRSTPSTRSSSARPTASHTRQPSRSPSSRPRPTTRSSSTADPDWGRPTCCMP